MENLNSFPHGLWVTYITLFGLCIGSFLNVCIHRMPYGESIVSPRSRCPACKTIIDAKDNIPVISFIFLKGKCRHCSQNISVIYCLIEIITALSLLAVYFRFGLTLRGAIYAIVICILIVITMIDLEHKIIPDRITLPGIVFGFAAGSYLNDPLNSLTGFFVGGGLFIFLAVVSRGGMGGGDIKFIAGVGALLGWKKVLLVIFLGSFLGSVYGLPLLFVGKKNRKSQIPFGPFLAGGTALAIFSGNELIHFYLDFAARI